MRTLLLTWLAGVALAVPGCTGQSLERTGYETMRNVKEQQCMNREMRQCPENPSWDEYQELRREPETADENEQ